MHEERISGKFEGGGGEASESQEARKIDSKKAFFHFVQLRSNAGSLYIFKGQTNPLKFIKGWSGFQPMTKYAVKVYKLIFCICFNHGYCPLLRSFEREREHQTHSQTIPNVMGYCHFFPMPQLANVGTLHVSVQPSLFFQFDGDIQNFKNLFQGDPKCRVKTRNLVRKILSRFSEKKTRQELSLSNKL